MQSERTVKAARGMVGIFILLLGFAGAAPAAGEEIIRAVPAEYDFGILEEGDPAVITVILENISTRPVEITNVRTN
jgi:hypothetical protein